MRKEAGKDFLMESWKNELTNKSFVELVEVVAFKERYNPKFVEMAQIKLREHEDYNENEVNTLVENLRKRPISPQKDPANIILKVANIGCITMKVLFVIAAIPIILFMINSNSTADNKVGALLIYLGLWGIYKFARKHWKKK